MSPSQTLRPPVRCPRCGRHVLGRVGSGPDRRSPQCRRRRHKDHPGRRHKRRGAPEGAPLGRDGDQPGWGIRIAAGRVDENSAEAHSTLPAWRPPADEPLPPARLGTASCRTLCLGQAHRRLPSVMTPDQRDTSRSMGLAQESALQGREPARSPYHSACRRGAWGRSISANMTQTPPRATADT